ncbi:protein kinase [Sorangium cellulosum]|uniref:non-specific serine/threonine protein kinase n=1 Tax=Sorangium cellulosum TaxID=56 RepID=A0A2L0EX26_SORCE|nr:serine/threonine-protein kinase [Sorangium cellulosum]AUX43799.1 protein kinase [Sorangium cellulosum]
MSLVCPRCRHVTAIALESRSSPSIPPPPVSQGGGRPGPAPPAGSRLPRCPDDGLALVSPEVLAEAEGDPFLGITIAERFVIVGKLGAGSMGTVYRARQEAMGRDVAIKILRSDRAFDAHAKARFTREARAMSLLRSPHTVTVFDFGEIVDDSTDVAFGRNRSGQSSPDGAAWGSGSLYLAMELLEGESLGQRLKRVRRLRVGDAVRFARHALLSLAEAHDKGIIHRDLKPDNLFLARPPAGEHEEICKVLDFGIAKVMTDSERPVDALETQAGTVFGTPRYMSPEQAQGRPLDARSDLYSLGVLLYQMLVGRPPFIDDDAVVVMARHIKSSPAPAMEAAPDAGIPASLSQLLERALAKRPEERPRSAQEFIAELDRAIDEARPSLTRERLGPPQPAEVGATGELLAIVGDGVDASRSPSTLRPARPRRTSLLAAGTIALSLIGMAFAVSELRRPAVPLAREADEGVARKARALAGTVMSAPPAAPPPAAPPAPFEEGPSAEPPLPAVTPSLPAATPAPARLPTAAASMAPEHAGVRSAPPPKRKVSRKPYVKFD